MSQESLYLHFVASGMDQISWNPSRWDRLIGSSLRRGVYIDLDMAVGVRLC